MEVISATNPLSSPESHLHSASTVASASHSPNPSPVPDSDEQDEDVSPPSTPPFMAIGGRPRAFSLGGISVTDLEDLIPDSPERKVQVRDRTFKHTHRSTWQADGVRECHQQCPSIVRVL